MRPTGSWYHAMAVVTTVMAASMLLAAPTEGRRASAASESPAATADGTVVTQAPASGYERVDGEIRGAFFILLRPHAWNGELVVLLRGGGVPSSEPVRPPDSLLPLAEGLAAHGFGVAMSSYRSNGFAVVDGIIDSRIAESQFTRHFGRPGRTFLWGFSMGTHILQHYLEQAPGQYAGGLSVCGALGGATVQWTTFVHKRALFDYFFPGVLPGDALSTPARTLNEFLNDDVPRIAEAILAEVPRAIEMTRVHQFRYAYNGDVAELINAVALSVAVATLDGADLVRTAHGIPVDTTTTWYSGSSDDASLNAGVDRFAADPNAAESLRALDPTGRLHGPILELHNRVDPTVPLDIHREAYLAILKQTGGTHLVLFREVDRYGHCEMTDDELFRAFADLVQWVDTGVPPVH